MRIALCFNGKIGATTTQKKERHAQSPRVLTTAMKYYKKNIIEANPGAHIDIFAQCWDPEFEMHLTKLLAPVALDVTPELPLEEHHIGGHVRCNRASLPPCSIPGKLYTIWNKWKAVQKVLGLKDRYALANGIVYDFIMLCRYDVAFLEPLRFDQLDPTKIYATQWYEYSNSLQHVSEKRSASAKWRLQNSETLTRRLKGYPHDNTGVMDLWFLGPPEKINVFKDVYNNLNHLATFGETTDESGNFSNHRHIILTLRQYGLLDDLVQILDFPQSAVHVRYLDEIGLQS